MKRAILLVLQRTLAGLPISGLYMKDKSQVCLAEGELVIQTGLWPGETWRWDWLDVDEGLEYGEIGGLKRESGHRMSW